MPSLARAGELSLSITDAKGAAVSDAVITVYPDSGVPQGNIHFAWSPVMRQQNIQFVPGTLIVPVGATVAFPNYDRVRHHVYSFSRAAKFELKLYGQDQSRSYTFPVAGTVALGCNIHDTMHGFIKVVDTPYAEKTDSMGHVLIKNLPEGAVTIRIWHPLQKAPEQESSVRGIISDGATVKRRVSITLRLSR